MTLIPFPIVPIALGVPALARNLTNTFSSQGTPLIGDDPSIAASPGATSPQWGIFLNGTAVIVPDSFASVSHVKEYKILDYPIETGAFETYNKVETPYDSHVVLRKGGNINDLTNFLTTIDTIIASLDLYDIIMPEYNYHDANIERYDFERNEKSGVSMLTVTLFLREVRVNATQIYSKAVAPAAAPQVQDGDLQAQVPTNDQTNAAASAPGGT